MAHAELKDHIEKNDIDTVYLAGTEMNAAVEVLDSTVSLQRQNPQKPCCRPFFPI